MVKKKNILFILVFVILSGAIPNLVKISAAGVNVGTLISYEGGSPTIDGVLNESQWSLADSIDIKLYLFTSETTTMNFTLYTFNSNNEILYLGAVIPDASQIAESFIVSFKTNSSEEFFYFPSGDLEFGDGHDAKYYLFSSDEIIDCYTNSSSTSSYFVNDIDNGGTNNAQCKSSNNSTHSFVEMAIPFDSGDVNGCDLDIKNNDTIAMWLYVEMGGGEFTQVNEPIESFDFIDLYIPLLIVDFSPTLSIPFFILITSITSLCVAIFYFRKKIEK
ncbi:MAG: hypothetical protein FK734_11485 [Asgard group archaeon]|nr:hypothetical protein [Asgard group archaeon]